MKKVTVTKFNVSSFGRVVGAYQAIVGLIVGLMLSLSTATNQLSVSDNLLRDLGISAAVAAFAVVIFPIVGFVVGWIQGAITAFVLNVIFAEANGLELEIDDKR